MGSLQILKQEKDELLNKAHTLTEAIEVLEGSTKKDPSPVVGAQAKRRTRVNAQKLDHYVLQALIDNGAEFMTGKQIIEAVGNFGFEITGTQMRTSVKRAFEKSQAEDNGEKRAGKKYRAIVDTNDNILSEEVPSEEPGEIDHIVGALDLEQQGEKISSKNAVVMTLSAEGRCRFGELVQKTLALFPGKFTEGSLKGAVYALAKNGDIQKVKEGRTSIYLIEDSENEENDESEE